MAFQLYTLPTYSLPNWSYDINIDGYVYNFSFRWNRRANTHYLTVVDRFGNVNIQSKKLLLSDKLIPLNLPSNSMWFLSYYNAGKATILEKPSDFLLGAFVLE